MNRIEEIAARGMVHEELTGQILEASFEVMKELGSVFLKACIRMLYSLP